MHEPRFTLPLAAAPTTIPSSIPSLPTAPPQPLPVPGTAHAARLGIAPPDLPPEPSDIGIVAMDVALEASPALMLDDLLLRLMEVGGSDLHLSMNAPPMLRIRGELQPMDDYPTLTARAIREALYAVLTDRQKQAFEENRELDLAYEMPGAARFRMNLLQQQGSMGAVIRSIPWEIKSLEALQMPERLAALTDLPRGLVLVTGPTGSGKSTTLAALIDRVNRTRKGHIITIEDPVEFVHAHKQCVVNQREVGTDTWSFANALKHALRQDPDVILVGEMRDLETISIALTAAETGHLVFATLHTSSAASTIDRIIDVFPGDQQAQVRTQLATSLEAIVCQTLCKTSDGDGRVAATEVLIATPAIRNLIREAKLQSIPSALQTGSRHGMRTLNQHLAELVTNGQIQFDQALEKCSDSAELCQLLGRDVDGSS